MSNKILWVFTHIREPIDGMLSVNGEKKWFKKNEDDSTKYDVYDLTEEQINSLENERDKYCKEMKVPRLYREPFPERDHDDFDTQIFKVRVFKFEVSYNLRLPPKSYTISKDDIVNF